eukprot:6190816-Pleurochrysis_carterae.AAC.1
MMCETCIETLRIRTQTEWHRRATVRRRSVRGLREVRNMHTPRALQQGRKRCKLRGQLSHRYAATNSERCLAPPVRRQRIAARKL